MRLRKSLIGIVAVSIISVGGLVGANAASATQTHRDPVQVLKVLDVQETQSQPTQTSFAFTSIVIQHLKVVGSLSVNCVFPSTDPTAVGTCTFTLTITGKGTLSGTAIAATNGADTHGTITAGTGKYHGAHGTVLVHQLTPDNANATVESDILTFRT